MKRTVIHRDGTFEYGGEVFRCLRGGDYGSGWNWEIIRVSDGTCMADDFDTLADIRRYVDESRANGWTLNEYSEATS